MVSLRDLHVQMHALLTQEEPWAASNTRPVLSYPALLCLSQLGYGSPFWNSAPSPLCALGQTPCLAPLVHYKPIQTPLFTSWSLGLFMYTWD